MLLLRINTLNYKDNSMAKVNFKIADRLTIKQMINNSGGTAQDTIAKHKELVENNFNTEVDSDGYSFQPSGWIIFSDESHVYKSWTQDNATGEDETRELSYFFEYHRSKILEDWKIIPPFGCIQKQRKVPGKSLAQLNSQELKQIDIRKFCDWWVAEQIHIHEVGCELSRRYSEFSIPFRKTIFKKEKYVFCFADLHTENIMIEPETNTYNFVDFNPIGWVPTGHYNCLYEPYLYWALETITTTPVDKYLKKISRRLSKIGSPIYEI